VRLLVFLFGNLLDLLALLISASPWVHPHGSIRRKSNPPLAADHFSEEAKAVFALPPITRIHVLHSALPLLPAQSVVSLPFSAAPGGFWELLVIQRYRTVNLLIVPGLLDSQGFAPRFDLLQDPTICS
jgi:hypothetical protein